MNLSPSSPPEDPLGDPGRNWRQAPVSANPQKPWWRMYGATLALAIGGLLHTGHHYWFVRSNPPPRFEELQSQRVEVLSWHHLHPQLLMRLESGQTRMVEFPTFSIRRDMYWVISQQDQRQLVGKTCQMWGRPLKFSIQDSFQVFALNCGDTGGLNFDVAIRRYRSSFDNFISSTWLIVFPTWMFLTVVFFGAETIRNRKSFQKVES